MVPSTSAGHLARSGLIPFDQEGFAFRLFYLSLDIGFECWLLDIDLVCSADPEGQPYLWNVRGMSLGQG